LPGASFQYALTGGSKLRKEKGDAIRQIH